MKVQCKKCLPSEGIDIPDFTQSEKQLLYESSKATPMTTIKYLIDHFLISHRDAKYITSHINPQYGHCNRCKNDQLDAEYIECQKCGALNFNWDVEHESDQRSKSDHK